MTKLLTTSSLLTLLVVAASAAEGGVKGIARTKKNSTSEPQSSFPFPIAPPSDGFCDSNQLGDDAYISVFEPCTFTFYKVERIESATKAAVEEEQDRLVGESPFSCDQYGDGNGTVADLPIKTEQRKVALWPDSCVANGPRCYSLRDYPHLENFTFFADTDYEMEFPPEADVVSVDCSSDFEKAQEFMDHLPEMTPEVVEALQFFAGAALFAGVAFILMGMCCCFGCFRMCFCPDADIKNRRGTTYSEIPACRSVPVQSWKGVSI